MTRARNGWLPAEHGSTNVPASLPPRMKRAPIPAMSRTVKCAKLGETLPALPYKPFNDALGQRIYDTVSAEAWRQWIEH
jgi:hypothetical protein